MTSFLVGAIKFGGNNASVTGNFISIVETEQVTYAVKYTFY